MSDQPLLSIIIANYNKFTYLNECLMSVVNQTFRDFEVIICDDNSDDDSMQIIKRYIKNYPGVFRLIRNDKTNGVSKARHESILFSKGKYLTTLDSDDYYFCKEKLEEEMKVIKAASDLGRDVIAFSYTVMVDRNSIKLQSQWGKNKIREGNIFSGIITRGCFIPRDFIFSRDAYFEAGGYDIRYPIYEDWDLKIRLSHKREFYYSGVNGIAYRRHGEGLSSKPPGVHKEWLKKVFYKNAGLIEDSEKKKIKENFRLCLDKYK